MAGLNRIQTIKTFFDDKPVSMDEMKALTKEERIAIAEMCKQEMVRRGSHTEASFDFSEK
jgi:hypothetical protein